MPVPPCANSSNSSDEKNPLVGALEFRDQRQLFLGGLHCILRMIVDRAESLIAQVSGAKVIH